MANIELALPTELFRPIIEFGVLDMADLCSIAQTSRLLRDEGQRFLFRNPGLITVQLGKGIGRTRAFFDAILSSPHRLALMVHTYIQTTDWAPSTQSDQDCTPEQLFMKMTEALKLMANVKIFHSTDVGIQDNSTRVSMVDCIRQCSFKLEEFAWNHRGEELRLLEEFLVFQNEIQYLEFYPGFDIRGASDITNARVQRLLIAGQKACPKLETLRGPKSSSLVLLPGKKNVKFISWSWALYITEALNDTELHVTYIGNALSPVQYLEYEGGNATGLPFSRIAPYLTSVVVLKISNEQIKQVSELSVSLPTLGAVHFFNEGFWDLSSPEELSRDYTFVFLIFARCKKLGFVEVDRYLGRSPPHGKSEDYGHITKRYTISPETRKVTSKKVNRSVESRWGQRIHLVAQFSVDNNVDR
ncbi:hypothetical protein D9619_010157 [Psilocybe cf. subviscida]|uniref:F-box domain-containing protein n=1 Tax=Psilocybe cf. subviscida TaxID=2480587 RepID=A0A8H5ATH8_9AGAR|nr:hypothetical protein D9619_010157 [Psilocybe cf. subviscida]